MKYLTTTTLALALLAAAAAANAAPPDDNHHTTTHTTTHTPPVHATGAGGPSHVGPTFQRPAGGFNPAIVGHNNVTGAGGHGPAPNPTFNHSPRTRDAGRAPYDASALPRVFQATRHFSVAPYHYPGGWYYRSWAYGDFLPWGWFAASYYLDWASYGLPPPPVGCEWVQEGTDALLVDVWTGEVLSVEPGIFYWS